MQNATLILVGISQTYKMLHSWLNLEEEVKIAVVLGTLFPTENWMHSGGIKIHLTWLFNQLHELSKAGQPSFRSIPFVVPVCPQHLGSLSLLQSNAEPPPYTVILAQGTFWRLHFCEKKLQGVDMETFSSPFFVLLKLYRHFSQLLHVHKLFYV